MHPPLSQNALVVLIIPLLCKYFNVYFVPATHLGSADTNESMIIKVHVFWSLHSSRRGKTRTATIATNQTESMQSDGIVGARQHYILLSEKETLKRES